MTYDVELQTLPARPMAATRFRASTTAEVGEHIGSAFGIVGAYLERAGVEIAGPAIGYYEPDGEGFQVTAGFPVAAPVPGEGDVVPAELPACDVAVTTHVGGYDELPRAYEAIHAWMRAHDREPAWGNTMWEEYHSDPTAPPEQTRTVICWPLAPRAWRAGADRPGPHPRRRYARSR